MTVNADLCQLDADVGPCDEFQTAFFYSAAVDRCEQFTWGGCGGNANRFSAREDCERRCRQQNTIRRPPTAQHDGKTVKSCYTPITVIINFGHLIATS